LFQLLNQLATFGKAQTSTPEDLEKKLRMEAARRFEWKKGALKKALTEAINLWFSQETKTPEVNDSLKILEEKGVIEDSFIQEVVTQKRILKTTAKSLRKKIMVRRSLFVARHLSGRGF
jgi:hypothetical protein